LIEGLVKITITSIEGDEPSFLVKEGTPIKEIEKQIKDRYGLVSPTKKGQNYRKHDWISQGATQSDSENYSLNQKILELNEVIYKEEERNRSFKKAIKNLERGLIQAHTKLSYIERTQNINWIENHPNKLDILNGTKKAQEIILRLNLDQIEKDLGFGEEEIPSENF